jgi:hypothetical protein
LTSLKLDKPGYNKILSREASEIWLGKSDKKQGCKNLLRYQKKILYNFIFVFRTAFAQMSGRNVSLGQIISTGELWISKSILKRRHLKSTLLFRRETWKPGKQNYGGAGSTQ